METKKLTIVFLVIFPFFIPAESLTISTIEGSPVSEIACLILEEIYAKVGIDINIISLPALRATIESTSGNIDGETHRVFSYMKSHPEVNIVQESYYSIETVLFTQKSNPALYASVETLPLYSFSILKGVEKSIELTHGFSHVQEFDTADRMMQFLSLGRIDFALLSKLNGISVLNRLELDGIEIYSPPLEITELYHYLHKSHSDLIPLLEKTIRNMKNSGELRGIIQNAEKKVMGSLVNQM